MEKYKIEFETGIKRVNMSINLPFGMREILLEEINRMKKIYEFPENCSEGVVVKIHLARKLEESFQSASVYVEKDEETKETKRKKDKDKTES